VKIDEVDVKILKTLLKNVRTSFSDIAKDCGMSSNAIRIRFERLKKNGVITGSITQVDPKKFGYGCVAFLMIKAEANAETKVRDFVRKIPNIGCFKPIGRYNIQCLVALKTVNELANTIEQINSHPNVLEVKEAILVDAVMMDHPENLTIEPLDESPRTKDNLSEKKKEAKPTTSHSLDGKVGKNNLEADKLDDIDMGIIEILSENASMSFRKIAKKVGVSTQSVIKRYKQMEKSVLTFSSITVNLKKLGYKGIALLLVKTAHTHKTSQVFDDIVQIPNVIVAHKCVGAVDMYLVAPFSDVEQLLEVKQRICNTPGVKEIELFIDEPFTSWPLNLFAKRFFQTKIKPTK
jgi:DNA-binding Lrp family transcriptional regulator